MDALLGTLLGTFGLGLITAIFAFSRERLNKADEQLKECREETLWYRDKLLPALERQQDILEHRQNILEHQQRILDAVEAELAELRRMGNDNS